MPSPSTTSRHVRPFNLAAYALAGNAARRPDKIALILTDGESDRRLTYGELDLAVRRLAAGLSSLGLAPGARVMIRRGNDLFYVLSFFACIAAGLVALPSSSQLTEEEADFLVADSGAAAIICSSGLLSPWREHHRRCRTRPARRLRSARLCRRPRPTTRPI